MAVTAIISLTASAPTAITIERLMVALKPFSGFACFIVGTKVQEPTTIQITSEWPRFHTAAELSSSTEFKSFTEAIRALVPFPITIILTSLDASLFADSAPPLVEYVKTDFPAELATPDLQKQVEEDFARFERIYRKRGTASEVGEIGLSVGWAEELVLRASDKAEGRVKSFLVIRGWEDMSRFEESVHTELFKECIPILLSWGAPFDLWHIERKAVIKS
ncbi:hypothetical protein N0V95_009212 [Ascochyta clinopodiicola]|nr:hypothetical protein N0V95_009212 [Ascochyta clinopodiicola]